MLKNHVYVRFRPGDQLKAGGKPSTGQHLPPRLYRLSVVLVFVSCLSCLCLILASPFQTVCFFKIESFQVEVFEVEVFEVDVF